MCNEKKVYESTKEALKRRVHAYPNEKLHQLTTAYARVNEMPTSAVVNTALKQFFESMPQQEKQRIINLSKNSY